MKNFFVLAVAAAALGCTSAHAGELRPFDQTDLCLDAGTEMRPGINRVKLAPCSSAEGQNLRRGKQNTIYAGQLCLQAITVKGSDVVDVVATQCHGRDGQRWLLTRDGRLTSGEKLCLTVDGTGADARLAMFPCKGKDEDQTGQKWSVYGKF